MVDLYQAFSPGELLESLGSSVDAGTPIAGSFTFDDAQENPQVGQVLFYVPPWSLVATVGDLTFSATNNFQILTFTTPGDEPPNVGVVSTVGLGDDLVASFNLYLKDPFGHPLPSAKLVDIPWDESLFPDREVSFNITSESLPGQSVLVHGGISSLSAPEPGPGPLLAMPVLALWALHFRRARG